LSAKNGLLFTYLYCTNNLQEKKKLSISCDWS